MSMHLPVRPGWMCAACALPWPCPSRQRQLLAEYEGARVSLMLYLAGHFVDACADLPGTPAGTLYRRFLGWPDQAARNARW
ncbi:MAG TPA: flavin reductase [Micromonosporaceae bacterium]|nr:flavin reductase [Micromonosporaceae bacterium]